LRRRIREVRACPGEIVATRKSWLASGAAAACCAIAGSDLDSVVVVRDFIADNVKSPSEGSGRRALKCDVLEGGPCFALCFRELLEDALELSRIEHRAVMPEKLEQFVYESTLNAGATARGTSASLRKGLSIRAERPEGEASSSPSSSLLFGSSRAWESRVLS